VGYVYLFAGASGFGFLIFSLSYVAGYRARQRHVVADGVGAVAHLEVNPAAWGNLPRAPEGSGYLYVIQFSSGTVKVGRATWPAQRLNDHRRYGWAFGVVIWRVWISAQHPSCEVTEDRLIRFAASIATGDRARREFFHGADFDQLVRYAESLAVGATPAQPVPVPLP
jgi:hypothetical protein